jgi:hypothetical protein
MIQQPSTIQFCDKPMAELLDRLPSKGFDNCQFNPDSDFNLIVGKIITKTTGSPLISSHR